jgi:parvulin-like peptidyl-prolyl isomerase
LIGTLMKCSAFFLSAACFATLTWSQTATPPAPTTQAPAAPAAATSIKPRGPEAVAAQDPNRVVAVIDGKQITAKQALDMLKPFPPEQRKQYESNLPNLIQQVYMRVQLADAAKKVNLDQQSPWKEQIELTRDNILAQAYLAQVSTNATKSAAIEDPQKYYDSHPTDFDSVKLSGIFVGFSPPGTPAAAAPGGARTESEARDKADGVEKKLKAGGDFTALARTESDNPQSAAKGGDLGTYNTGDDKIPADVKTALTKLQTGQYSEPIHIPSGFLIVKVDSRTKLTFEQARAGIVQRLQSDKSKAVVQEEIDKYKIQVQDSDFFNASNAPAANIPSLQRPASPPPPGTPAKPKS